MSSWMIRAGRGGIYAADWLNRGLVGIGWDFGATDIASMSREQIRSGYAIKHPNDSKNKLAAAVGQIYRFAHDMEQGSTVVMYDPETRLYHIVAEVKHRKGAMGAPAVRSFIGGLRAGDRGLYVSTGGFTKEARYEADRATIPIRLLDLDSFVRHYVEVYDKADEETRSILPLTRIWWPA